MPPPTTSTSNVVPSRTRKSRGCIAISYSVGAVPEPPLHVTDNTQVRDYWNAHIHDVGCGAGTDLARFAREGAIVTGVDISASAIALARQNFAQQGLTADLREADGEQLPYGDNEFDLVFAHGVVQYTTDDRALVAECRR